LTLGRVRFNGWLQPGQKITQSNKSNNKVHWLALQLTGNEQNIKQQATYIYNHIIDKSRENSCIPELFLSFPFGLKVSTNCTYAAKVVIVKVVPMFISNSNFCVWVYKFVFKDCDKFWLGCKYRARAVECA